MAIPKGIFNKKKRRVIGEMVAPGEVRRAEARVSIQASSKQQLVTYESEGLVVAINGSGSIGMNHPHAEMARSIATAVTTAGGIIITGGRATGIMGAASAVAGDHALGVIFPELKSSATRAGALAVVNAPVARVELLATCAPVIILFRGGLGTMMGLLRAIVHLRNREYHPDQLPQYIFVNTYWVPLLSSMKNMGCLPKEYIQDIILFDTADDVLNRLSITN